MPQAVARSKPKPKAPKRLSTRQFRQQAESLVEQMIGLLDSFDGDPDVEGPDPDLEPSIGTYGDDGVDIELDPAESEESLGWTNGIDQSRIPIHGASDEYEAVGSNDRMENQNRWSAGNRCEDDEPSLGAPTNYSPHDQTMWAIGGDKDLELEHDGAEDGGDDEPSLGSLDRGDGSRRLGLGSPGRRRPRRRT